MDTAQLISIQQFCLHYNVPIHFVKALKDYELIEFTITEDETYLQIHQLNEVEKMIRMHYDLKINFEGIDVIYNLLKQVEQLQDEVRILKNKLNAYEDF